MRQLAALRTLGHGALLLALLPVPLHAQIASTSARALGLGGNSTAAATGYHAVAWNPALLATAHNPASSFAFVGARGLSGFGPVGLTDLAAYQERLVPTHVKQDWLERIAAADGQRGMGGGDVSWIALQIGRVALQATTSAGVRSRLSPGVAELLLFGNVDADGEPRTIELGGSTARANAYSAFGFSYAQSIPLAAGAGRLSVGMTAKYIVGHATAWLGPSTGATDAEPLSVEFELPIVYSRRDDRDPNQGTGFGLDVGVAYEVGIWTVGAALRNVVNTFSWDESKLAYSPYIIRFDEDRRSADWDERPFSAAPAAVRAGLRDQEFAPALALGVAARPTAALLVAADLGAGSTDAHVTGATRHAGAGLQYEIRPWLPVQAGGAVITIAEENDGFQFGAGAGLRLGPISLAGAYARRSTELGVDNMLTFSGIGSLR